MQSMQQLGLQMRDIKVKKEELLTKIKENREKHIKDYNIACEGYREMALDRVDEVMGQLKHEITSLKQGQVIELMTVSFDLEVPRSYERVYDQAIQMLEMTVDDIIVVSAREFACFVRDDWDWKESFTMSTMNYSAEAVRMSKLRRR